MEAKIQREYSENICAITVALLGKTVYTGKALNRVTERKEDSDEKQTKKQNQETKPIDRVK